MFLAIKVINKVIIMAEKVNRIFNYFTYEGDLMKVEREVNNES